MDDSQIQLTLAALGITPDNPSYAAISAALRQQAANIGSQQGVQFGEEQRQFDAGNQVAQDQVKNQRASIDNQYNIAKLSAKTSAEQLALDKWKAEQDTRLREAEIAISQGNLQVAQDRLGIDRGAQGLDLLKTTVDLNSTPRNWAKLLDWRRGVAANNDAPVFIQNLLANAGASAGSAAPHMVAPVGLPEQNSLAATLADLGYGQAASDQTNALMSGGATPTATATGAAVKPDPTPAQVGIQAMAKAYTPSDTTGHDVKDMAFLNSIAALAAQGTAKSSNRVAQLAPDEQQALAGGLDKLGIGGNGWLQQSEAQRVGNSASGLSA